MTYITPILQYEIRFTGLLAIDQVIREALQPFLSSASEIKIENELVTTQVRYTLYFKPDNYSITISWDRIIFKYDGDAGFLTNKNSIVQQPFFSIVQTIRENEKFGNIQNELMFVIFIKTIDKDRTEITEEFKKKYLKAENLMTSVKFDDFAVTLEDTKSTIQTAVTFGPYLGKKDLDNRKLIPISDKVLEIIDVPGLMMEIKLFNTESKADFSSYGDLLSKAFKLYDEINI